ncbi:MAG: nucleotidyltransferase domain-containing protein [Armatimonadota bacterium]
MSTDTQLDKSKIDVIVSRIVEAVHPQKIVLFGSRARNQARPDSDIDILVITESSEPRYRRSAPIYGALSDIQTAMDVVVYTPEEVAEWSQVRQAFITTALREGKVLYEDESRRSERLAS